ncbi:MAG: amino acid ABC transporter permease [Clostridiales bacterium]
MSFDFSVIYENFDLFLPAALLTLQITCAAIVLGTIIGLIVALLKISKFEICNIKILATPATFYITVIRGTPIILQLFVIYYGLAEIVKLNSFLSATIAFGLHNGAYIAEIFRGAIESIDKGQLEAAKSLGMSKSKAMERIILPQALKRAIPSLGNQFIIATKDSSLANYIALTELMGKAQQLGSSSYKELEYYVLAGIYYLIMTSILSFVVHKIEYKLAVSDR